MVVSYTKLIIFVAAAVFILVANIPTDEDVGYIYYKNYKFEKAYTYLVKVVERDKDNIFAMKRLAQYYVTFGKTKDAMKIYERLHELKPKNRQYINKLMQLYDWNAMTYKRLRMQEKLLPLIKAKERVKVKKSLIDGFAWIKEYEDSDRIARELLDEDITLEDEIYLANYFMRNKLVDEAIGTLQRIITRGNIPRHYFRKLADVYKFLNFHDKALRLLVFIMTNRKYSADDIYSAKFLDDIKKYDQKILDRLEELKILYFGLKRFKSLIVIQAKICEKYPKNQNDCLFELADYYYMKRDTPGAIEVYKRIANLNKYNKRLLREIGDKFEEYSELDLAIVIYKRVLELEIGLRSPAKIYERKDKKKKEKEDSKIQDGKSKLLNSRRLLATAGGGFNLTKEIPEEFLLLAKSRNPVIKTKMKLIDLYEMNDQIDKATKLMEEVIEQKGSRATMSDRLKLLDFYEQTGDLEKAITLLEPVVFGRDSAEIYPLKLQLLDLYEQFNKLEEAIKLLEEIVVEKKVRSVFKYKMNLLDLYEGTSKLDKAIGLLNEHLANRGARDFLKLKYKLLDLYEQKSDLKNAIKVAEEIDSLKKNDEKIISKLGDFYLWTGQTDKAGKAFERVLRVNKRSLKALKGVANYYLVIGKYKKAFNRIKRYFNYGGERNYSSLSVLSQIYGKLKMKEMELSICSKLKKIFKQDVEKYRENLYPYLTCLYAEESDDEIEDLLKDLVTRHPREHSYRTHYIDFLLQEEEVEDADRELVYLKLTNTFNFENIEQEKRLEILKKEIEKRNKIFLYANNDAYYINETNSYRYLTNHLDLTARFRDFVFSLKGFTYKPTEDGKKGFYTLTPYLGYGSDYFELQVGYSFVTSDIKTSDNLTANLYIPLWKNAHANLFVAGEGPYYGSSTAYSDGATEKNYILNYTHDVTKSTNYYLSYNHAIYKKGSEKATKGEYSLKAYQAYDEYYGFGPAGEYISSNLSSNSSYFDKLLVKQSNYYKIGVVSKLEGNFKSGIKYNALSKLFVAGDSGKKVAFGNIFSLSSKQGLRFNKYATLGVNFEYTRESTEYYTANNYSVGINIGMNN